MDSKNRTNEIEQEDTSSGNEIITRPFNPNDIEIETPPFSIGFLIDSIKDGEINMNTEFQREGNLWSKDVQSRLIESILLGLPLPAFYFDATNVQWDIIDGLQRCCTIYNFCIENNEEKKLKLTGLEFLGKRNGDNYLEGLSFDELPLPLQTSIKRRQITIYKLKKAPRNVRYVLFKRLNTDGLVLTPQEIRNAIYQGKAADTIKHLAKLKEFIQATGGKIKFKRMEDRDFASRFIAFYLIDYRQYQPGLDDFINSSMEILEKTDTQLLETDFRKALRLSIEIFGNDAFRKRTDKDDDRRPINKAYFEVIVSTFAKMNDDDIPILLDNRELFKDNLITLMKNPRFFNALSQGTGTTDSVQIRFSWFQKILNASIKKIKINITHDNKIEYCEL